MKPLRDVWVNWQEGVEEGFNVHPFYEWRKEDNIKLLVETPIIGVTSELYEYIENGIHLLPIELLDLMKDRTAYRENNITKKDGVEYCGIVTDGKRIIMINVHNGFPMAKSRLVLRQERAVFEEWEKGKDAENPIIGLDEEYTVRFKPSETQLTREEAMGLTRKERRQKELLLQTVVFLKTKGVEEIRYWLLEWDETLSSKKVQSLDREKAISTLIANMRSGWEKKHENFAKKIIQVIPSYKPLWEFEEVASQASSGHKLGKR